MNYYNIYSTAKFKLNRTRVQLGYDMTRFSFRTRASLHVHARLVMLKPAMQSSCVHTRRLHDACVHVRNAHAKFRLRVHANCKPRTVE